MQPTEGQPAIFHAIASLARGVAWHSKDEWKGLALRNEHKKSPREKSEHFHSGEVGQFENCTSGL